MTWSYALYVHPVRIRILFMAHEYRYSYDQPTCTYRYIIYRLNYKLRTLFNLTKANDRTNMHLAAHNLGLTKYATSKRAAKSFQNWEG